MGYRLLNGFGNIELSELEKAFGATSLKARHVQLFKSAFADNSVLPDSLKQITIGVSQPQSAAELLEALTQPNVKTDLVTKHLGPEHLERIYWRKFAKLAKKKSKTDLYHLFEGIPELIEIVDAIKK